VLEFARVKTCFEIARVESVVGESFKYRRACVSGYGRLLV
jgi:hypothetical protein